MERWIYCLIYNYDTHKKQVKIWHFCKYIREYQWIRCRRTLSIQKNKLSISGKQKKTSYKHIIYSQVLTTSFCVSNLIVSMHRIRKHLKGGGEGHTYLKSWQAKNKEKEKLFTDPQNRNPWRRDGFNLFFLIITLRGEI